MGQARIDEAKAYHRRSRSGLARLLVALAFLPLIPAVAIAEDDESYSVFIPEPMVFDLVQGLGVQKGAFEVNTLVLFPINDATDRDVEWAPEVEYAVADGVALEFELGFDDESLHAYKLAAQFTFGTAFDEHFIHGSQLIVERIDGDDIWEFTGLYLMGIRFDEDWSILNMLGLRTEQGGDADDHNEALWNFNLFRQFGPHLTIGVESDLAIDLDDDSELQFFPQLHYEFTDDLELQITAGVLFGADDTDLSTGFRIIYSR